MSAEYLRVGLPTEIQFLIEKSEPGIWSRTYTGRLEGWDDEFVYLRFHQDRGRDAYDLGTVEKIVALSRQRIMSIEQEIEGLS